MNEIVIRILSIERIDELFTYNTTSQDFSLKEKKVLYNNDGSFNSIKVNENIFANILDKNFKKVSTKKLKDYIGNNYINIQTGHKIHIDKDLPGEYIYSKYTLSLKKKELLIKLMLINYLKEILNYCHGKVWKANSKNKHRIDGKYGFYKFKIELSVKFNNTYENYIAFVLIRNSADKKKYLYDILSIKKID